MKELEGHTCELDPDEDEKDARDRRRRDRRRGVDRPLLAQAARRARAGGGGLQTPPEVEAPAGRRLLRSPPQKQKKADGDDMSASGPPPPPSPGVMPSQSPTRKRARGALRKQLPWGPGKAPPPMRKKKGAGAVTMAARASRRS